MSGFWSVSIAVLILAASAAVWLVARDYRRDQELSWSSVLTVWGAYLLHAGLVFVASWRAPFGRWPIPAEWVATGGAALLVLGVAVCALAVRRFASWSRMSGRRTDELVTSGAYSISRNPQNLGWGLALLGASLAGRSTTALLLTLGFGALVHFYLVKMEEPYLARTHGREYERYLRRVSRYLGTRTDSKDEIE